MPTSIILPQVDMARHTHPALAEHPTLASNSSGWSGFFFHHYNHTAYQSPKHQWVQHIIGITGPSGHPAKSEHRVEGQLKDCYCQPGEMLLVPAGVEYSSLWHQAGEFSLLGFSSRFIEQIAQESIQTKRVELTAQIGILDPLVQQIALVLKADVEANHPAGRLFGESLVTGLVIHLIKQYSVWPTRSEVDERGRLSDGQLQKVRDYIQAHLDRDIALSDMADVLNLSQYHFCRVFKQSTGETPHRYVTQCRLDRAKHLLLTTQLSITDIAFAIGLSNHSSFTRLFKKYVGVTPKTYRASA